MRENAVLRVEIDGVKVEMDPTLLGSTRVQQTVIEQPAAETHVAGGPEKRKASINPLLRHKSLGLELEFAKPVAP